MSLKSRLDRLEKALPQPQGISLAAMMAAVQKAEDDKTPEAAAERDALSEQFLATHGITLDPAAVVEDRIERELERRIAEAEGRRLPCGLKVLTPEAQVREEATHDGQTDTRD
jgi:hypothetical protein